VVTAHTEIGQDEHHGLAHAMSICCAGHLYGLIKLQLMFELGTAGLSFCIELEKH
jgi:hypothetical protein